MTLTQNKTRLARACPARRAFTLIELLVVISIISLLISILMPSLSRARAQAKGVHCLAKLKDVGNALAAYENVSGGSLPPALWNPVLDEGIIDGTNGPARPGDAHMPIIDYGWAETLFSYLYAEPVSLPHDFPVLRNIESKKWENYFVCKAVGDDSGVSSGHYRVYLPAWSAGSYRLGDAEVYDHTKTHANPRQPARREQVRPKLPLIGDANERSERGDGFGDDDCSYIDAGEANYAGSNGRTNGNRFSDRHYGGTNYLFQDLHAAWNASLRDDLARDYDLNGVRDVEVLP